MRKLFVLRPERSRCSNPQLRGYQTHLEDDPDAFIIMVSGFGMQSKVIEAINLGAADFVVKPYMKSAVLEKVGKVLEEVYSE